MIEIDSNKLPILVKAKGKGGQYVDYILKATRNGIQLIKPDKLMLQLLEQN
ncbi:hypothetical protein SAMN02745119_02778 [Trichlorobacter thiogenes]|uniref:Uncharacterized protein n=1 Tax=Trichlorobacter thiogenes TaxID=115783 RepID=A0A1T4RCD5_9BACT|nr:hypothetical protein [Trichlorobacter thiogenes]SKA13271.1 hypothetical protein SAMN02745119_02778 [Trichlorobacter thiogenes]